MILRRYAISSTFTFLSAEPSHGTYTDKMEINSIYLFSRFMTTTHLHGNKMLIYSTALKDSHYSCCLIFILDGKLLYRKLRRIIAQKSKFWGAISCYWRLTRNFIVGFIWYNGCSCFCIKFVCYPFIKVIFLIHFYETCKQLKKKNLDFFNNCPPIT